MNRRKIIPCLLMMLFSVFVISCKDKNSIREEVMELESSVINVELDSFLCLKDNAILKERKPLLRLVEYIDSAECVPCAISKLTRWEQYIRKLRDYNDFQFMVIIEKNKTEKLSEQDVNYLKGLSFPVYIDSLYVFKRQNPQIPNNELFHTFLLTTSDSVVFVGNPMKRVRVDKVLIKILNDRLIQKTR